MQIIMDLQIKIIGNNIKLAYNSLVGLLRLGSIEASMKKALTIINKVEDNKQLFEYVWNACKQEQILTTKIRWLHIISCFLQQPQLPQDVASYSFQIQKILGLIYQLNSQVQNSLQNLNFNKKLQQLKEILSIFVRIVTIIREKQQRSINILNVDTKHFNYHFYQNTIDYYVTLIINTIPTKQNILHRLSSVNCFLHILQKIPQTSFLIPKIKIIMPDIAQVPSNQLCQQLYANTFIKYYHFIDKEISICLNSLMNRMSTLHGLKMAYSCNINNTEFIRSMQIESNQELQVISFILQKQYHYKESHDRYLQEIQSYHHPFIALWLEKWHHLQQNYIQIDIQHHLTQFPSHLIIHIYLQLTSILSQQPETYNKIIPLLTMWKQMLSNEHIYSAILNNKNLLINAELILYKYLRQIINYPPSQNEGIVLQIFAKYFNIFLLQNQCIQLRKLLIIRIINDHLPLLTDGMLMDKINNKLQRKNEQNVIDLELYSQDILNYVVQKHMPSPAHIHSGLSLLNNQVSLVLLKYIIHTNTISIGNILLLPDMLTFTIKHNIELHLHQYEYLILQLFKKDLQNFIKAIYKQPLNIYKKYLNIQLINIIMNEQYKGKENIIKITTYVLEYLTSNMPNIYQQVNEMEIDVLQFSHNIIHLFIRSLYYNFLPQSYSLLIAIKSKINCSFSLYHIEQIIKFIKMNYNQKQYLYVGFSILFASLYGTAISTNQQLVDNQFHRNLYQSLEQHGCFMIKLMQMLQNEDLLQQQQSYLNIELAIGLRRAIRVNFLSGIMRHITIIKQSTDKYDLQIKSLNKLIEELIITEKINVLNIHQSKGFDFMVEIKKRHHDYEENDEQQIKLGDKNNQSKIPSTVKTQQNYLQWFIKHLKQYADYDEIMEYKMIQKNLRNHHIGIMQDVGGVCKQAERYNEPGLLEVQNLQRVNGKIRKIIHVKK